MPANDSLTSQWSTDISQLLGIGFDSGLQFWNLLKNLECHKILEQHFNDKSRKEFDVLVAPIGVISIKKIDDKWKVTNFEISSSFEKCLNETLRCEESNLYRELYDRNLIRLGKCLDKYTESQRT